MNLFGAARPNKLANFIVIVLELADTFDELSVFVLGPICKAYDLLLILLWRGCLCFETRRSLTL